MPDEAPISIDSAVSLMTAPAAPAVPEKKETAAAPEAPKASADAPAEGAPSEEQRQPETPAAPAAEDKTTPAQDDAPAITDGKDEQGSHPPIEPPSGWKAEKKEVFKSLPR